ncbi:MAG TPA: methyltransferase, partial [Bradyrhizobium sp.]
MPLQSSVRALKKPPRLDDEVRFLRSWIEKPL